MPITGIGSYFYWREYFSVAISGTLVLTDAGGNTSNNWVYAYGLLRIDLLISQVWWNWYTHET